MKEVVRKVLRYLFNWLLLADLALNTLLGGDPFETVSSRLGRRNKNKENPCRPCQWICWALNLVDESHCANSAKNDRSKREVIHF